MSTRKVVTQSEAVAQVKKIDEARKQASEARAKRNAASGKASHAERVAARSASEKGKRLQRTGTGSVTDRLGRRDTVVNRPQRASVVTGKSSEFDSDAVAAYNKEPVDHAKIHETKPHPEAQQSAVRAGASKWNENKHPRRSKGAGGGRWR